MFEPALVKEKNGLTEVVYMDYIGNPNLGPTLGSDPKSFDGRTCCPEKSDSPPVQRA